MDFNIMAFDETTVEDFHDVILPNVLAELYGLDDFSDYGIFAIGAMQNERAIGAAVVRILSDVAVQILSLYVVPEFRRAGVASVMIDGVASLCFDLFDTVESPEVPVGIGIDYVMDDAELEGFGIFLDKAGFRHREERPPVYLLPAGCADALPDGGTAYPLPDSAFGGFSEWAEEAELYCEPELCVYAGAQDDPQCLLVAINAGDGSYDLISHADEPCSDEDFAAALRLLMQKLDKNAAVYADAAKNVCPEVLARAAGSGGRVFHHSFAQRRMIIEKGAPE